ncbi:hypothetical protein AB0I68_05435 [Streptomyces sp. NPDC050448]|uniref:hypothetical protein n=1 Tax=Streptomyces sp. NPDC050448 TaxID=3155404 RepID=UPI00344AFF03
MTRWGLLVEQNLGSGRTHRVWSVGMMGHVEGTREEALAELRRRVETFEPMHPHKVRRRAVYRTGDGFLMVLEGSWQEFHCRFSVAEQLYDSAPPPEPPAERRPESESEPWVAPAPWTARANPKPPAPPAAPPKAWDADVPASPSWLDREDPA